MKGRAAQATPTTTRKASPPTTTAAQRDLAGRIRSLKDRVEDASADEATLLEQIDGSNARRRAVEAEVADLGPRLAAVEAEVGGAQARLEGLESASAGAGQRLDLARRQLVDAQAALQRRAIVAYTQSPASRYLGWLLRVRTMRDVQVLDVYAGTALRSQSQAVRRYDRLRFEVQALRDGAERARAAAVEQRDLVTVERGGLEEQRRADLELRQQAAAAAAGQKVALDQILARKREFQSQIAALQRQSDSLASVLRQRQSAQVAAPVGSGVLSSPIPGAPITSRFGPRVHPIYGDVRPHNGIDLAAGAGTSIHAAADGTVVSSGPLGGYGTATVVDHGNTLATLYAHQSATLVAPGTVVKRGQVIGRVGCTGLCTGPHLHFEVRKSGTPVDPMPYL